MKPGEVLKLVSDCPGVRDDIAGWVEATHLELVTAAGAGHGATEFYLRKL
jgi:TusA-related sulfurtransferase